MKYLKKFKVYESNYNLIDSILDKINKDGIQSLTIDERTYLQQHSDNKIDKGLESWLFSSHDSTFDDNGKKLLYNEFEEDEDIFYNTDKLIRVISHHINKKPFTNNSDWGGNYVWGISGDNFIGMFLYFGDDGELLLLNRQLIDDQYQDDILKTIDNSNELYKVFLGFTK
jgi:hypothetical protein